MNPRRHALPQLAFVAAPELRGETITFEEHVLLASFRSDGLYDLAGLETWNGQPLSEDNRPSDEQRRLQATINFFVHSDAPNVLFVQITDVSTTTGAFWFGTAFNNVTQTGVRFSLPLIGGGTAGIPAFSSDFANPGQVRAFGGSTETTEPLTDTPGYALDELADARLLIHTTNGSENGFTSLGNIHGASRIRGGGVFQLTFDPGLDLFEAVDVDAMTVESEYGAGSQYIEAVLTGTTPFGLGDLNCDGAVDLLDIGPFVLAVTRPAVYIDNFPDCFIELGDVNQNNLVNGADTQGFVNLLLGLPP